MRWTATTIAMLLALSVAVPAPAQVGGQTARERAALLHQLRSEKLDVVLPLAMRDNGIDMWIHAIRAGNPDPLQANFGNASGYLIFTDRGGDRVERAVFGGGDPDLFDIFGSDELTRALEGYGFGHVDPTIYDEITRFIEARDPATIAVNTSGWLAVADGISHSDYLRLETILGPTYSQRVVSAENLITDFRAQRTQGELDAFAHAAAQHLDILERALSREVITPGVTTLDDVGWWVREEMFRRGLNAGTSRGVSIPRILYSAVSEPIDPPDVRWWIHHGDYVIQRGDFMTYDIGVSYLDYFVTDYKRNAYVLREDETAVPASLQHAYDQAIRAREFIAANIRVGQTARETLDRSVMALEEAQYIYTPFIDIGTQDYEQVQEALAGTELSGFSIDLHSQGHHGGSLVTVGPSVAPFRSDRDDIVIRNNNIFSFEYMVHTNLPERPGYPMSLNIEGNHVVTADGVEFLHPPNERIILIR
jgi:Xaa-Pro aminopeptidase